MTDQITVVGNLTSAPERRATSGGVTMATFGVATTERRLENGAWVDGHTNYYSVSTYRALAEHVLRSLERGQRVIVVGKLKLRKWEVNGRSGTSADLDAASVGHDLMFGVATFVKDGGGSAADHAFPREAVEAPAQVDADGWAVPGAGAAVAAASGPGVVSGVDEGPVGAPPDGASAGVPVLIGAGGVEERGDGEVPF